jgi:hypothetical protein
LNRLRHITGVATVEFALAFSIFVVALLGVVEFGRLMLAWNTAAEATRLASRLAAICDPGPAQHARIRNRVRYFIEASGQLQPGEGGDWLEFDYLPAGCTASNCTHVQTNLKNLQATLLIPTMELGIDIPAYRTRQVREIMRNVVAGEPNSACD